MCGIKAAIKADNLKRALSLLDKWADTPEHPQHKQVIILISRYNEIRNALITNTRSSSEISIDQNKLKLDVLNLLDDIMEPL